MSLLLNGGGVGQLKTISIELNKALEGRETDVRSVLDRLDTFMANLDENKGTIVRAIESLNRLAISLNKQQGAIEQALDEMPAALASINRQRDDLVKMLRALSELSAVGTQVIRDSKAATIDSLEALAPTLTKLAEAGDALPKSLQTFLTYPFVDAVVGTNPAQARNLHMGDYTNLSVRLDLEFSGPGGGGGPGPVPGPGDVCDETPLDPVCETLPDPGQVLSLVEKCLKSGDPTSKACTKVLGNAQLAKKLAKQCKKPKNKDNPVCAVPGNLPDPDGDLPGSVPGVPGVGLPRAGFGATGTGSASPPAGYDSELAPLLAWGLMER